MATPTDIWPSGYWPIGGGQSGLHASHTEGGPAGPVLLTEAAVVLPMVVGRGRVRCVDVHTALCRAGCRRGIGRDRPHRLQLADEALELFAAYLVTAGFTAPAERAKLAVRDWLTHSSEPEVQLALAAAAGYWRRKLAAAVTVATYPHAPAGRSCYVD